MFKKEVVTKDNYKEIMLKRAIITCWILLIICFIVKILGGNFFTIACNNEKFVRFCDFCDTSVIKYIIYFICFVFTSTMLIKIVDCNFKLFSKKGALFLTIIAIIWVWKFVEEYYNLKINTVILNVSNLILLYLTLAIFTKKFLKSIIVVIYDLALTMMSVFIKSIGVDASITESFIVTTIYLIDYYIMLVLSVLYTKKIYLKKGIK